MKKSIFNYTLLLAITSIALYSCVKKTTYNTVPEIEYKEFYPYVGDSALIQIKFTDGDGDIGVSQGDSTRTIWVNYYYRDTVTNKYRGFYDNFNNDTLKTGYIVKAPNDSYKGKPISGELLVKLQQFRHSKKIKDLKYVIYLYDNAGNKSNVVTTPAIIVQ